MGSTAGMRASRLIGVQRGSVYQVPGGENIVQPAEKKKTSPWLYVGIGCGVLLFLGIGATVATVMFVGSKFNELKEDMTNPVVRSEKVKKTLGVTEFPEGYYPVMALSVPAIMDMAILSTKSPDAPA